MDFHSLMRRDLQFLCKKNKIPANLTNVAMADALNSLEIVEGIEEFVNKSPTSVAKQAPKTATRTTRKTTTTVKAKAQVVSGSTSKSLGGEMAQENDSENVAQETKNNNVGKTPAARSTRKVSCSSKVQESKKSELVQSVYSTRRSTRLLEKCMGDLSLMADKPEDKEETERKVSAQEENLAGSEEIIEEAEVIPSRDVRVSMEEEWKMLKNGSDQVDGNVEIYVDLGDITAVDANTETNKEEMNEVMSEEKELEISVVQVDNKEEVILQSDEVMCEEGSKKKDNDQEIGDIEILVGLGDIPVLEHVIAEKSNVKNDSENVVASESSVQVNQQESEYGLVQADKQEETLQPHTPIMCEEGSKKKATDKEIGDIEVSADLSNILVLELTNTESNNGKKESENILAFESLVQDDDQQETEEVIQKNDDSEAEKFNTSDEEIMMDQISGGNSETEPEEDNSSVDSDITISEAEKINMDDSEAEAEEEDFGVDSDSTISEADSNQAVLASNIAEEEMILSESAGSDAAPPASPTLLLEEAKVNTTPFAAETISVQFPRPTTALSKNSALKLANIDNENKENNMEMMMTVVNNTENGDSKVEAKKKKVAEIDEEKLKGASMRQLVKMVKELEITSKRPALQILSGNDQTAE